jgi:tetratricopeptide (TPR) repeat protein
MGRAGEAETFFKKIITQTPRDYSGHYGLGQAYAKQGRYEEALAQFSEALTIKPEFAYAYVDRGMSYAALGQKEKAYEDVKTLDGLNKDLADELRNALYRTSAPGFLIVSTLGAFDSGLGPGTPLAELDPILATPGATKDFTMTFYFDKDMDVASVQTEANWNISRATGATPGGAYNWGMLPPSSEVNVAPLPSDVTYNPATLSAAVTFSVAQNGAGDGTIDPSHLVFRFYGKDAYGISMDRAADEYVGISLIV